MAGWQEGHPAHKNPVLLIPRGSVLENMKEEDPKMNQLKQVILGKTTIK